MDNLEERNKVLEMCSFPTLNQEERENRNRPVISNETESVILKKNEHLAVCTFFLPPVPMTVSLTTHLNMTGPNSQNFLESIILWMSSVVLTLELVIKCALRYVTVNLDFYILKSICIAPVW